MQNKHIRTVLLILITLLIYTSIFGKNGLTSLNEDKIRLTKLIEMNKAIISDNQSLRLQIDDLRDHTKTLEEKARLNLGMIKDDEILLQIVNSSTNSEPKRP